MAEYKPLRFGKYTLLDRIGVGGMAELYRALITGDRGFEKLIAVKRLLPHLADEDSVVASFIDEAKLAALLQHRNIVQIYDFGSMEGSYFIAMEYLFGKDLQAMMKKARDKDRPLGLANALCIAEQVCEGLDYAHKLKDLQGNPLHIIHRDVSPQNIFINYGGEVKIIDFGIAKASSQSDKTQLGTIKGKVAYMSPEQAQGEPIDHRSDIFAAGILLYEMLTGARLFSGDPMEVLAQVREARFVPPKEAAPDLPGELHRILERALSMDPAERYQTCGGMYEDLDDCVQKHALRPTPQALALFMKDLYEEEIETEELTIHAVTKVRAHEQIRQAKSAIREAEKTAVLETEPPARRARPWMRFAVPGATLLLVVAAIALYPAWDPTARSGAPVAGQAPSPAAPEIRGGNGPAAVLQAGLAALEAERYRDAAVLFEETLEADPNLRERVAGPYDRALREMAAPLANDRPLEAERLLLKAAAAHPQGVQSRFQLGLLYVRMKDYPKARETFEEAAALEPSFADIYFNLGYVHAMTRDYAKAEEMYHRVVELAPMYLDEAYFNLAMVQEKAGKVKESLVNLEQAVTVNPENRPARKNLERLKQEVGKF
ncbi:MAG: protein kinase [Deltaproteobacteria bacterium]|nr:protein kinase [Deltaproteobacteria bacterium]